MYDETACGYVYDGYENYLTVKFKGSSNAYYYMPNLYAEDDTYLADRNAFANTSTLYQANISLIRNADHVRFVISNADTGEIYSTVDRGASTGAYYSSSSGAWGRCPPTTASTGMLRTPRGRSSRREPEST